MLKILMFGPGLSATSGISAVVNHWLDAGMGSKLVLDYVSTLDEYVPGQYFIKLSNALRAHVAFLKNTSRPDIVHLHLSHGRSFYRKLGLFLIARHRGLNTVIHLHGSTFQEFFHQGTTVQKVLIRFLFDKATAIIVLSEKWKLFVNEISINPNTYIVPNGAPIRPLTESRVPQPDSRQQVLITFMGRLGKRKGIYDLLQAFERLSKVAPNAYLVLGGDGEIDNVKRRVRELKLQERVEILGWVRGQKKTDVFDAADIYVLPSYNEGLPGSILEAMAAGKPIVSTPVGGIPEAVMEGYNGYLVTPGDIDALYSRLLDLCKDMELRLKMGKASRLLIEEKFDIRNVVERVLGVYEDILSKQH